jgi:hypothetical protein
VTNNLGYDLTNGIEPEISTARADTATLANDLASLSAAGLPAPAGASATIAAARSGRSIMNCPSGTPRLRPATEYNCNSRSSRW